MSKLLEKSLVTLMINRKHLSIIKYVFIIREIVFRKHDRRMIESSRKKKEKILQARREEEI